MSKIEDKLVFELLQQKSYLVPRSQWSDKLIEELSKTHEVFENFEDDFLLFKRCNIIYYLLVVQYSYRY